MKHLMCVIFVLALAGSVLAQPSPRFRPPGGGGGRPPGGFGGGKMSNEQAAIGLAFGIGKMIIDSNRPPQGGRPPYGRPPGPRPYDYDRRPQVYVQQPPRVVYVKPPVTPANVQIGTVSSSTTTTTTKTVDQKPLNLTKNTTTIAATPATKNVVAKAQNALKKEISTGTAKLVDSLKEEVMPEEKVDAIKQKLIEEGKDKMKVVSFASAIEEGETDNAVKLISELMDDPFELMKITKEINLAKKLSELGESLQGDDLGTTSDLNKLKKLIDKSNLSSKIKKNVKKTIEALNVSLQILETLAAFKESSLPSTIFAPTGAVTVITVPTLEQDVVYAIDTGTYIIYGDEFAIGEENISVAFPQIQVYSNPVAQSSQRITQINLSNTTGRSASYYLDDRTTRTLNSGNVATFDVPDSGTINVRSQGRWKAFTVGSGNYSLEYDNGTWSVAAKSITVTLDNSANPVPFHCFVDRTEYTINPGEQMAFTSSIGILDIQFARGEDTGNGTNYIFEESTTLKAGLDQRDNKWALFQ